jgi:hypothetical protein
MMFLDTEQKQVNIKEGLRTLTQGDERAQMIPNGVC